MVTIKINATPIIPAITYTAVLFTVQSSPFTTVYSGLTFHFASSFTASFFNYGKLVMSQFYLTAISPYCISAMLHFCPRAFLLCRIYALGCFFALDSFACPEFCFQQSCHHTILLISIFKSLQFCLLVFLCRDSNRINLSRHSILFPTQTHNQGTH